MKLEQSFRLAVPLADAWEILKDTRLLVECLPGAALEEVLDPDHLKGALTVRLGPVAACFRGEVTIQRNDGSRQGTMSVHGVDKWTRTRVRSHLTYTLVEADPGTDVNLVSDISLMGMLAQVARKALLDRVATRLIGEFATALAARIEAQSESR